MVDAVVTAYTNINCIAIHVIPISDVDQYHSYVDTSVLYQWKIHLSQK